MKKAVWVSALWLTAGFSFAKEKPETVINVIGTDTSERPVAYTTPGTASQSTSNCSGNATAVSLGVGVAAANGTTACTTTTMPGMPARMIAGNIPQTHVRAIMSDGKHIMLWCQPGFRACSGLEPGYYNVQLDGNNVFVLAHDLGGKAHRIKYRYEGGW
jgi:hypothetical protein